MNHDHHFLLHATRLAERGLGRTWPNPTVGCVLVKDGQILATARTADGGRPHAEAIALAHAGEAARGATAYVSLEPCAHYGQTPPCAQTLIDAGIARVVVSCLDPDPRVSGQGIALLQAAGVEVCVTSSPSTQPSPAGGGGFATTAPLTTHHSPLTDLNRGFFRRITHGLPHVAMKLATSLDGRITDQHGRSQWITGEAARAHGNHLRGQFDCVLTGIGTVRADDPQLTVRAPNSPHPALVRVVADRQLRLPLRSKLVRTANMQPVWVITTPDAVERNACHATELREAGVKFLVVDTSPPPAGVRMEGGRPHAEHGEIPPPQPSPASGGGSVLPVLRALAAEGITRVLVEAGSGLSTAFLAEGMVETLHWYRAPILLGNAGKAAVDALDNRVEDTARHTVMEPRMLGVDSYERIELHPCSQDL